MAGTEIRLDAGQVQDVLESLSMIQRDLHVDLTGSHDVPVAFMGQQRAASGFAEFVAQWREGRDRVTENLGQLRQQGISAIRTLQEADNAVRSAGFRY
jgi:hypothetical protein